MRRDRARAWTVYDAAGNKLTELRATVAAIRQTLPNALIEMETGRVTIIQPGRLTPPAGGESQLDFDVE